MPGLTVEGGLDRNVAAGETVTVAAVATCPDAGLETTVTYRVYNEASAECAKAATLEVVDGKAQVTIPAEAVAGDTIHVIVKAQSNGHHKLAHYQQVILTVA